MVDRQHRPGGKAGSAGIASSQDANIELRERLRKLAMETIDLKKDPYFLRNHLGTYECRLCLTLHTNEGSYLAHTQGKKHQTNLARRQAKDAKDPLPNLSKNKLLSDKKIIRIGRPGYRVEKSRNPETGQKVIMFEIHFTEIDPTFLPRYRIMSAYEQKIEIPEKHYQYVVFAGDPYENIAFKVPNWEIDQDSKLFKCDWNKETKKYVLTIVFKGKKKRN